MGVSTAYESSPGLHTTAKCISTLKGSKPTVHKRQHRLPLLKRRPRVVRFDIEANQVQETERIQPEARTSLFWTRIERDDIQDCNHRIARQFLQQQPLSVEKANVLFDRCCQGLESEDSSSEEEEFSFTYDEQDENDDPALADSFDVAGRHTIDVPTEVRGLEWSYLPAGKKYRQVHIQRVLKWQRLLQSGADKEMLLASRAIRSSRPSREMARIWGTSDEIKAKDAPTGRRNRRRMLPSWW